MHILRLQFYHVGLKVTGGNTTLSTDVNDIEERANTAFMESLKNGTEDKM